MLTGGEQFGLSTHCNLLTQKLRFGQVIWRAGRLRLFRPLGRQ